MCDNLPVDGLVISGWRSLSLDALQDAKRGYTKGSDITGQRYSTDRLFDNNLSRGWLLKVAISLLSLSTRRLNIWARRESYCCGKI